MVTFYTLDGCPFDPAQSVWRVRSSTNRLLFDFHLPRATGAMADALRASVARLMRRETPELAYEALSSCRVLLGHAASRKEGPVAAFDVSDFQVFRAGLSNKRLYRANVIVDCLIKLVEVGFERLCPELNSCLPNLRISVPARATPA